MKLALTVWDGRISPVFDVCRKAIVLDLEGGRVTSRRTEAFESDEPACKIDRLAALGVNKLVCGAISASLRRDLLDRGIEVVEFVAGEVDDVLRAVISGRISDPSLRMPGYRQTGSPHPDGE
jgi:predicted Fe-Mo cluster-binding NifX family protein